MIEMSLEAELHSVLKDSGDTEALLEVMRRNGCAKIESIKILMRVLQIPLSEAKVAIHNSFVWRDVRDSHEEFHDHLLGELDRTSEK